MKLMPITPPPSRMNLYVLVSHFEYSTNFSSESIRGDSIYSMSILPQKSISHVFLNKLANYCVIVACCQ